MSSKSKKFRQAPPSADLANIFGVEKYVPKNGKKDARATCAWELGCDDRAVVHIEGKAPEPGKGFSEKFCQRHGNVIQTKFFDYTLTVKRLGI